MELRFWLNGKEPAMGLFSKKDKRPAEYLGENRRMLDEFTVTRAWGVKKYRPAMQFVYDQDHSRFVVVEGPVEDPSVDFRDKDPDVVSFDQVKDVWLEVDEYWTEGKGEYEPRPVQTITQDRYKDVYWRYDFYLNIDTDHPYAGTIRYQMNFKPTVMKVPEKWGIFYRRGAEIGGKYRGGEITQLALELQAFDEDEHKAADFQKKLDTLLVKSRGKSMFEGVRDKLVRDAGNAVYFRKLAVMGAHVARADRISRLLLK
jgi:hypothetical protein